MPRRADYTQEQFSQYYRYQHIKAAGDQRIPALVRYVQSHRVAAPPSQADFSAVAEVWYESEAALTQFTASPHYARFRADELNFVDVSRAQNLTTVDHVILDGERKRGMVKGMFMIQAQAGPDGSRLPRALAGSACADRACGNEPPALRAVPYDRQRVQLLRAAMGRYHAPMVRRRGRSRARNGSGRAIQGADRGRRQIHRPDRQPVCRRAHPDLAEVGRIID